MIEIHHRSVCEAPVEVAFAYIDDPANVPHWMFGISAFRPRTGAPARGLGAVYEATFSVKPVKLSSTVEVVEYVENEALHITSIAGFTNSSTWRFTPEGAERTTVDVTFGYELPGGLAGKALGRVFEPVIALTVRESDKTLRRLIAEQYAASRG